MEEAKVSDDKARPAGGPMGKVGLRTVATWEVIKGSPDTPETETEEDK